MPKQCSVDGCDRFTDAKGMCAMHYGRWRRYGDPLVARRAYSRAPAPERFWTKVDRRGPDECWLWLAGDDGHGYGVFVPTPGKKVKAHRYAYEQVVGPIPAGLHIDHLCRTPACVNPAHMEPVTNRVNTQRGITGATTRARMLARTHCKNGHPWDEGNTRYYRGNRVCRACNRERQRAYTAAARRR